MNVEDVDICNLDDDKLFELLDSINYSEEIENINKYENMSDSTALITKSTIANNHGLFCTKCNSGENVIEDTTDGVMVCQSCGNVLGNIFDYCLEQKAFSDSNKDRVERCGNVTSVFFPQASLGTTISGGRLSKIKKLQQWSAMPYKEKSLYNVLKSIQLKCSSNGIMKCIEDDAKILYKNISESKHETGKNKGKVIIIRGINRKSLIAACVFYACKRKNKSKSPKEIATMFDLDYKDLTKGCKIFKKMMKMKYMPYDSQIAKPEHYITDYCKLLNLNKQIMEQALLISSNIQKLNVASMHTPVSIAIGSILVAMGNNGMEINKNHIAKKFSVSAVTVSKAHKQISTYGTLLSNSKLVDDITKIADQEKIKIAMPYKFKLMYDKIINKPKKYTLEYLGEGNNLDNYINSVLTESNMMIEKTNHDFMMLKIRN